MNRIPFAAASFATALTVLAGAACAQDDDYLQRMAREHAGDSPVAGAASGDSAVDDVTAESIAYWPDNAVEGYLARPSSSEVRGGILVIQEWWGLNDNIRTMARRLAAEGYLALAVDLYEGEVATNRDEARALVTAAMENADRLKDNLRAAHAWLAAAGAGSVGTIGWCFGGGWSLNAAIMLGGDLDAAVIYYGRVVTDDQLATIEAAVLGHFGSEDGGIPLEGVRAFEARMQDLGKEVTVHVYEGADHAFANPSGTRFDEAAATQAWHRTLKFFAVHLDG